MMRFLGGNVAAVRANEQIQRVLTLSGIDKVIDVYEGIPQQLNL